MDDQMKKDMISVFNEGIEQLVIPTLEDLSADLKEEINKKVQSLRTEIEDFRAEVNGRFNRLERKVGNLSEKVVLESAQVID